MLLFCAVAFAIDDQSLRSTLIGGLVASAGAAVAFYFSSKSSDQARSDILSATFGTVEVPNLVGMTVAQARTAMASASLSLRVDPATAADTATVSSQLPPANSSVPATDRRLSCDRVTPRIAQATAEVRGIADQPLIARKH